ncbi:spermatogenesis-associated protein 5 [Cephus cinctus]|uniref:Spermatogenesis-associated protein 5 n=1 Tax=Cephus cinctus TaxID=211228 RepID=A0AAJ7BWJ2_CEPCN|nr:spermatogenesis-associated protein 5 [Cephus cinctus]
MSAKSKKNQKLWCSCNQCNVLLTAKEEAVHKVNCPPSAVKWKHSYIKQDPERSVLYSTIEIYKPQERPKNLSERELNDMVFIAQSTMQLCKIAIGEPVILITEDTTVVAIAWPTADKSLLSVSMTKNAIDLKKVQGLVKVEKLDPNVRIAREITIEALGKQHPSKVSAELDVLIKNYNEGRIYCIGNRISIPFYGQKLLYRIADIKLEKPINNQEINEKNIRKNLAEELENLSIDENADNERIFHNEKNYESSEVNEKGNKSQEENLEFFKAVYSTKWKILQGNDEKVNRKRVKCSVSDIGGYDDLLADIRDVMDIGLGRYRNIKGFGISKGLLLYGTAGVGKSMIANALISEYDVEVFAINSPEIYSKYVGETEARLKAIFEEVKLRAPSIILIEDIDNFCPKRSSTSSEQEKRILGTLVSFFDDLQELTDPRVLVLATTSRLELVDLTLRRPGRFDKEFEVCVPTPRMRHDIFVKFLLRVSNTLTEKDVRDIAFVTHGFVGADLYALCSRAAIHAIKRQQQRELCTKDIDDSEPRLTIQDFSYALTAIKPSAMKEVLVEVPDVKWSDIGGQKELKLKLKQAVEWPLKHPEAFTRLGIRPPRGVLMFGPPGCSKTMIAKALATESQLNFLSIKGPELFSKWVGESERAVREVFRKARQVAPSIIFIDEIDALGGERMSSSSSSGNNVQERVLAQLLTELDGVTALGNVTLLAATNRPDRIDNALLRPGRFDRIVYVPLPDAETRLEIFQIKLKKMPAASDVRVQDLVDLTEGYSGAEVEALCHEAAMKALEEDLNAVTVTKEHFKAALAIVTPRTPPSLIALYQNYINKI